MEYRVGVVGGLMAAILEGLVAVHAGWFKAMFPKQISVTWSRQCMNPCIGKTENPVQNFAQAASGLKDTGINLPGLKQ